MVTLGSGRDDPRTWVRVAHLLADAAGQPTPGAKLPTQSELTTQLGISLDAATRACQKLAHLGLIHLVPGHGYHAGNGA